MMPENVMVTPLFHQRSHSMPVGHAFINNDGSQTPSVVNNNNNNRTFDFKRPSPLKNDLSNEGFPLPVPKSLASQLSTTTTNKNNEETTIIEPKFFCNPKTIHPLYDYNTRQSCPIMFNCKMDRGFFVSQSHWTCYRRNYFQVTASFIIPGHSDGTCYALQDSNKPIQQFFLRLKACTSTNNDKKEQQEEEQELTLQSNNNNMIRPVALTQMTPKRDKGPQREPPTTPIIPSDTIYGCEQVCITFERLQFRVATANNGKRRASQQYFRLIFELLAQLDDQSFQIISECYSSPLVVRGRSPGHYSSEPTSISSSIDTSSTSSNKKKRKTSPITKSSYTTSPQEQEEKDSTITLPPPQYVFASPPMIIQQQQQQQQNHTRTSSSSAAPYVIPTTSAFSNFHNRSQSANDSEFFSRHRPSMNKYQPSHLTDTNEVFDPNNCSYEVGMARALRNWQQQVQQQQQQQQQQHQRNDSFESFDNNSNSNRASTRPGTPIPYHHNSHHNSHHHELYNNTNYQYVDSDKRHHLLHDSNDMYNNNSSNTTTNNNNSNNNNN